MAAYSGVHRLPVAAFVCFAGGLCLGQTSQYVATTIAGGGLPATPAAAVGTPVAYPHSVVADSSGNLYFTAMNCVFQVDPGGTATRVAGNSASPGYSGDGGPATSAQFSNPQGPAIDGAGNLYVADSGNGTIRRIGPNGVITSLILNGSSAYFGVRSPLLNPSLDYPTAVAVDGSGNLYIAEPAAVLRVAANGALTTIAGTGVTGDSGDGGPATSAQVNSLAGIAVDASGNVYIADNMSNRVRRIGANGTIITVAGTSVAGYSGDGGPAPAAQLNSPNGISLDATGALYIADTNNYVIRRVAPNGTITTVAGDGKLGYAGDGGPAGAGQLSFPNGIAADTAGNLYIADTWNSRIRKVNTGGALSTYAGNGTAWWGDGGPATSALLYSPWGVALDGGGNVYIGDSLNNRVRRVNPDGVISTVAGTGAAGYSGDGGQATDASLNAPQGVAVDAADNLLIADSDNARVRKVSPAGIISTAAGSAVWGDAGDGGPATAAQLMVPVGVTTDAAGNFYVAESWGSQIRKVSADGTIGTIAGTGSQGYSGDGGPAAAAALNFPSGVAVDGAGDVYIADTGNYRVRKVATDGSITTIAGTGVGGFSGDGGLATAAQLLGPNDVAVDAAGNLYIADSQFGPVRQVAPDGTITTVAGSGIVLPHGVTVDRAGDLFVTDGIAGTVRMFVPLGSRAVLGATLSHAGNFTAGQPGSKWSVVVSNAVGAGATSGAVSVSEIPPAGVTVGGMSGEGWSCASNTCTRSDSLSAGASYAPIAITAQVSSVGQAINQVSVTGGGSPATGASDLATIALPSAGLAVGADGAVNAGSYAASVAPGSIAAVFGSFLLNSVASAQALPLPNTLSGLSLQFGGVAAPLFYASSGQVNVQVPWELAGQTQASLVGSVNGQTSAARTVNLAPFAPAIFTMDASGGGQGAILDAGYRLVGSSNPANPGDTVQIFCTGLGAVTNQPATGHPAPGNPLATTTTTPTVTVNGGFAPVAFAGLVPGLVGEYQVNVQVPGSASAQGAAQEVPVVISIGGATSNAAIMWVRQ